MNKYHFNFFLSALLLSFVVYGCGNALSEATDDDTIPPAISIASPLSGYTYGLGTIIIQGSASDDLKVVKVETCVDGGDCSLANSVGFASGSGHVDWVSYVDTSSLASGPHTISAIATDLWDNTTTAIIDIIVDHSSPLALISGSPPVLSDITDINIAVSGSGISAYKFKLDYDDWSPETPVETPIVAAGLGAGEHSLLVIGKKIVAGREVWQDATEGVTRFVWGVNTRNYFSASDGGAEHFFGQCVAISSDGKTIVAGAFGDSVNSSYTGSAYVYRFTGSTWSETKLIAPVGTNQSYISKKAAISSDGNTIVIGLSTDNDNGNMSGSVYVYKWTGSTWNQTKPTASDGGAEHSFGQSVAVSSNGNTVVIGAEGANGYTGSAYVYNWTGSSWNETKITASEGAAGDYFGRSAAVSSDGNTVVIGASLDDDNGISSGSAYVYKWTGSSWNQTKIRASDGTAGDFFGQSAAISSDGNTLAIGARRDNNSTGSAYVYSWTGSTWNETKLIASDGTAGDNFGECIAISSDGLSVVIGAPDDDELGDDTGSAYVFNWTGASWDQTKLFSTTGAADKDFGVDVAVSDDGSTIIIGSAERYNPQGSVHLFYQ